MTSLEKINQFNEERNWGKFHNPKDLAMSISIEAAELLEFFQWRTAEEAVAQDLEHLKEEIADVLIYSYLLANKLDLDIDQIIAEKLAKNALKYPVNPISD